MIGVNILLLYLQIRKLFQIKNSKPWEYTSQLVERNFKLTEKEKIVKCEFFKCDMPTAIN